MEKFHGVLFPIYQLITINIKNKNLECTHFTWIVAMARQMGYEPPNTDVLGTKE
ncbi:hypothetical protein bpmyx0001_22110 [Bacillus pseudomycoides DSM 12442]|nr:hypothetical protein bpmyx0001_22110 [Bacillus pseudomycoides DSM 12442]